MRSISVAQCVDILVLSETLEKFILVLFLIQFNF